MDFIISTSIYQKHRNPFIIVGAVEAGRKYHCTPMQSLDCKELSTGFFQ